jgi:hypothetical protein
LALYAVVLVLPWALGPHHRSRNGRGRQLSPHPPLPAFPAHVIGLFSLLGIGFMAAELALLARFTLLFSSPAIALAVFLSTLLGWAGLGSWISRGWHPEAPQRRIRAACRAIVPTLLVYALLLPWVLPATARLDEPWRWIAGVCLLMPIGVIAGVPFPSAVQWLTHQGMENHIPWMYGINGVSSVAGSTLALLVAIRFGFQQALWASAGCYLLVFLMVRKAGEQKVNRMRVTIGTTALN